MSFGSYGLPVESLTTYYKGDGLILYARRGGNESRFIRDARWSDDPAAAANVVPNVYCQAPQPTRVGQGGRRESVHARISQAGCQKSV